MIDQVQNEEDFKDINKDSESFSNLYNFLIRNAKSISFFTILITLFGLILFSLQKRTWKGEFQIVLENNDPMSTVLLDKDIQTAQKWLGNKTTNVFDTEVGILESPSTLMPIFEFVRKEKIKKRNNFNNIKFKDWRDKFIDVKLIDGTSILELSYQDKDKELILPTLNKISKSYQEYSGKKKLRNIELGKNFFNQQIALYKKKSADSLKASQTSLLRELEVSGENIERIISIGKLASAPKIETNANGISGMKGISRMGGMVNQELIEQVENVEKEIALNKRYFKDSDPRIKDLKSKKRTLGLLLKKQMIDFISTSIPTEEVKLFKSEKLKGSIGNYRQLLAEAERDEIILISLETNYRQLLLEEAKKEDPWKLITNPTLLKEPEAPLLKNFLLSSIIGGFLIGTLINFLNENRNKIVYSLDSLNFDKFKLLNYQIPLSDSKYLEEILYSISESVFIDKEDKLAIIDCGENNSETKELFNQINYSSVPPGKIEIIEESQITNDFTKAILIIKLGLTTKTKIEKIYEKMYLSGIKNLGFVAIDRINLQKKFFI